MNAEKGKIIYSSKESKYNIVYDVNGDYFRIEDTSKVGKRRYVDSDGKDVSNMTIAGRTFGRSKADYERLTHFKNEMR